MVMELSVSCKQMGRNLLTIKPGMFRPRPLSLNFLVSATTGARFLGWFYSFLN